MTLTDDVARRISATTIFDEVRDRLLSKYAWNFAIKRKTLATTTKKTITSITHSSTTATVTITAHGYSTDMYIKTVGATQSEYNGTFQIIVLTDDTFTYTMDSTPTVNASGTITAQQVPGFEFDFIFSLPTDCLRVLEVYALSDTHYVIESNYILCDKDELDIKYIKQVTDYTLYPQITKTCLALALSAELSPKLGRKDITRVGFLNELAFEILEAYKLNALEGNPNVPRNMQGNDSGNYSWQKEM